MDLATLVEDADNSIRHNSTHVLRHYLKDKPVPARSLRARAHNFVLPPKDNRNFVSRALYEALCPSVQLVVVLSIFFFISKLTYLVFPFLKFYCVRRGFFFNKRILD